jgi:hypothetical protein
MIISNVPQNSPDWYALRIGLPTASCFDNLVTSTGKPSKAIDTYARTLAAEKFVSERVDPWAGNTASDRGHALEEDAAAYYEFTRDVTLDPGGFITNDARTMGCSPDRLVGSDGILEIKCLKAENHIKAMEYVRIEKTCPPDYMPQTQGQLMICEREWLDLLFYHDVLPPVSIRLSPDRDIWEMLESQVAVLSARRDELFAMLEAQKEAT